MDEKISRKMTGIKNNKWETRSDMVKGLLDLIRPLKPYFNEEKSLLKIGHTAAHYGEKSAQMEGWARVLWGLGPLFAADNNELEEKERKEIAKWLEIYKKGLVNGTDPGSFGYWGDISDYDQKMVETAAVSVALMLGKKSLWEPLSEDEKKRVEAWLRQINSHNIHANNWRFFRILANLAFAVLGLDIDDSALVDDFTVIENSYVSDGWYFDGHDGQMDYYIPFALHFYGLIWAALAPVDAAERAGRAAGYFTREFKEKLFKRGVEFAKEFSTWFSDDGTEVPFGRSLTYRFAHGAFFSALVFAMERSGEDKEIGKYKHLLLSNLRSWFKYPILDEAGFLTIGYRYPNLLMSEKYNAPGSPYWSFKIFLVLALSHDGAFWRAKEEHISFSQKSYLKAPHMIICHEDMEGTDHVTMFPTGQHSGGEFGNCDSKYKKFVYSNRFGFSIQRGNDLESGAFDNTLVVSREGENMYHMPKVTEWSADVDKTFIVSEPIKGVRLESTVIPVGCGWHVRVHKIDTGISIDVADGGFAVPVAGHITEPEGMYFKAENGVIGAYTTDPEAEISFKEVFPNTNLMAPLTAIPYIKRSYEPGKYLLVNAFFATTGEKTEKLPDIRIENDKVMVGKIKI